MKNKILRAMAALILAAAVMGLAACSGSGAVDLGQYIAVKFAGTNGSGEAFFDFDYAGFEQDMTANLKDGGSEAELAKIAAVEFTFELDRFTESGLSNGDAVTVTVSYDGEIAKEAGFSFKNPSRTFTVEGLE